VCVCACVCVCVCVFVCVCVCVCVESAQTNTAGEMNDSKFERGSLFVEKEAYLPLQKAFMCVGVQHETRKHGLVCFKVNDKDASLTHVCMLCRAGCPEMCGSWSPHTHMGCAQEVG